MMVQGVLFDDMPGQKQESGEKDIGRRLSLKFSKKNSNIVFLYNRGIFIKKVDLSDRPAKRLLVVEAVEMGAIKTRLAEALKISRQSIHNYTESKKHFGIEGVVHNYSASTSKSLPKQRHNHANQLGTGNKARQLEQIRKEQKQNLPVQAELIFEEEIAQIEHEDHPYAEEHEWEQTRYAGVFVYVIALITQNQWLRLVMGHFGIQYKIFMVFVYTVTYGV